MIYYLVKTFVLFLFGSNALSKNKNENIKGKPQSKPPLDLSNRDVEDASYHEIKKDAKNK